MSLDLDEIVSGWECPSGEVSARVVESDGGGELLQLRVDLGLLQMQFDGRPDGSLYHGLPTVLDYVEHELRVGRDAISIEHWQALDREVTQFNYRRLAFTTVAENALRSQDEETARRCLARVLRDIECCQHALELLLEHSHAAGGNLHLVPTLTFNHARLLCQLRLIDRDYEGAVEAAEYGAETLREMLGEDDEEENPGDHVGVAYLYELARQLRTQHDVDLTLREQLEAAVAADDFETAAELHEEVEQTDRARRESLQRILDEELP